MNLLRRCHECGQPLGKKELFCPRCGVKQPREPRRSATGLGIAVHRARNHSPK